MPLILCNTWKVDFLNICFLYRDAPPLLPSDTTQGYRTVKAKLGCKKVRPWKWMPFTNPARRDGAIFHHWRRVAEEGKDYPFARFNKVDMHFSLHVSFEKWGYLSFLQWLSIFFTPHVFGDCFQPAISRFHFLSVFPDSTSASIFRTGVSSAPPRWWLD